MSVGQLENMADQAIEVAVVGKNMSIAFGTWLCNSGYEAVGDDKWKILPHLYSQEYEEFTTEDLYHEFILRNLSKDFRR